jgi:tRNA-2-methylthio-N6-dimethylallyladenosine synthase
VTRGCNNFCSYCIVPYTRGRERRIPHEKVIESLRDLKKRGFREVTLLGQNVNSYYDDGVDFAGLLRACSNTGMEWIRFLTSHPKDLGSGILDVMGERPNICPHLHLPLQSGSDRILSSMNRGYTVNDYLSKAGEAREKVEGLSLTTDFIFGFPGETDEDFEVTLELMKKIRFNFAFLYRYSEREGTKAASFGEAVPEDVRLERLSKAIVLQRSITAEKNKEFEGTVHRILVKNTSKDGKGWFGMTETNIPAVFTSSGNGIRPGVFADVMINSTTGASLVGRTI